MLYEESNSSPVRLQVISLTGLDKWDKMVIDWLEIYLKTINLPDGFSGEIVFDFPMENGRVGRIVLDDGASTLDAPEIVDPIKRSLLTWRIPYSVSGTVRLTLRIDAQC